jgi:hypothetical protein
MRYMILMNATREEFAQYIDRQVRRNVSRPATTGGRSQTACFRNPRSSSPGSGWWTSRVRIKTIKKSGISFTTPHGEGARLAPRE